MVDFAGRYERLAATGGPARPWSATSPAISSVSAIVLET